MEKLIIKILNYLIVVVNVLFHLLGLLLPIIFILIFEAYVIINEPIIWNFCFSFFCLSLGYIHYYKPLLDLDGFKFYSIGKQVYLENEFGRVNIKIHFRLLLLGLLLLIYFITWQYIEASNHLNSENKFKDYLFKFIKRDMSIINYLIGIVISVLHNKPPNLKKINKEDFF